MVVIIIVPVVVVDSDSNSSSSNGSEDIGISGPMPFQLCMLKTAIPALLHLVNRTCNVIGGMGNIMRWN
jgi:hypothetical protein